MMSRMLGAPLGGTTRGGHHGVESVALSLITPPNGSGGGGICFPSIVVVALGEPNTPATCCAATGATARMTTPAIAAKAALRVFIDSSPVLVRSQRLLPADARPHY